MVETCGQKGIRYPLLLLCFAMYVDANCARHGKNERGKKNINYVQTNSILKLVIHSGLQPCVVTGDTHSST